MLRKTHPDYLVRKVEELATVLARLLGFKGSDENHEIINLTEETFDKLFGDNPPLHSKPELITWLESNGLSQQDLINLTDILFERAEALAKVKGEDEAQAVYEQTLTCMEYTVEKEKVFLFHWASRMDYLKKKTKGE